MSGRAVKVTPLTYFILNVIVVAIYLTNRWALVSIALDIGEV